jgi:hypothetical protein
MMCGFVLLTGAGERSEVCAPDPDRAWRLRKVGLLRHSPRDGISVADPAPVDMSAVSVVALVVQQSKDAEFCELERESKGLEHHVRIRPVIALRLLSLDPPIRAI